ncbi:MAG: hypothetical protein R2698_09260 [Microthrixaceae bacterium]
MSRVDEQAGPSAARDRGAPTAARQHTTFGAVRYRVGRWLHRHVGTTAIVTVLVAVVLAPVLSLWAGARRTATLVDRHVAAHSSEFDFDFQQEWGASRTAEVEALPGVERAIGIGFVFGVLVPVGVDAPVEAIMFAGDAELWVDSIVAGRLADPAVPTEFVATREFAALGPYAPGDKFTLKTFSAEAAAAGGFAAMGGEPDGPTAEVTLVGVISAPAAVELDDRQPIALFPNALFELGSIGVAATIGAIATADGVDAAELRRELDTLEGGSNFQASPRRLSAVGYATRSEHGRPGTAFWPRSSPRQRSSLSLKSWSVSTASRRVTIPASRLSGMGASRCGPSRSGARCPPSWQEQWVQPGWRGRCPAGSPTATAAVSNRSLGDGSIRPCTSG